MAGNDNKPMIVIKRINKGGHGHHGGAWKVAYADFVTAMMAFFLLLWLLNVTTAEQKNGIADYFTPTTATISGQSGAGDILGGATITVEGTNVSESSPIALAEAKPTDGVTRTDSEDEAKGNPDDEEPYNETYEKTPHEDEQKPVDDQTQPQKPSEDQINKALQEREQKMFEEVAKNLQQAIQGIPELKDLEKALIIDQTPEGLRIQLVDQEGYSMFPRGSFMMEDRAKELIQLVSKAVKKLDNKLSISGHTDSTPFANENGTYTNWELSSDRANAARRIMQNAGISPDRLATVVGRADREPFIKDNPADPRNRRLSIILLRKVPLTINSENLSTNEGKHSQEGELSGHIVGAP